LIRWWLPLVILVALLGSCATSPPRAPAPAQPAIVAPPAPTRLELLAEVRAAAEDAGDVIQVAPLRDPAVTDLLDEAAELERIGELTAAAGRLQQALALTPGDPQLMQEYAELLLALEQLDDAEALAARSFEAGPQLGGLCRRNWATVQIARRQRGDGDGAAEAAAQMGRCIVEPQLRM
jgi:tetratricopeptide (TPR) repeat protein